MSPDAKSLLSGLLIRSPQQRFVFHSFYWHNIHIWYRLGGSPEDAHDIMRHAFFSEMDWEALYHKQIEPPFKPGVTDDTDTRYFDQVC
jgi:hypothetical protein